MANNINNNNDNYILKRLKKAGKIIAISTVAATTAATGALGIAMYKSVHPSNSQSYQQPNSSYVEVVNDYIDIPTYNELNTYDEESTKIPIKLSDYSYMDTLNTIQETNPDFRSSEYYGLEQALDLYNKTKVNKSSESNLLTEDGKIDVNKLYQTVLENNRAAVVDGKNTLNSFYENLETSEIRKLCETVAKVTNANATPDEIKNVANTLTKLTMFQRRGTLANAYVSPELTLVYNPLTSENYETIKKIEGEKHDKTIEGVITHEIYHLIQHGSNDNNDENGIEAGFCRSYNNKEEKIPVDSLWYSWVLDGSAEIGMSKYLNINPGTYQKKISYIKSFNLSRFNEIDSKEKSLENAVFNPGLEEAFKDLGIEDKKEQLDFLKFMYSIEITQVDTNDFWNNYSIKTGNMPVNEAKNNIRMSIRTDAVQYLTKNFFENLADSIHEGKVTDLNTAFYLMRTWELVTSYHLEYNKTASFEQSKEFITWYDEIQNTILTSIAESSNLDPKEVQTMYNNYNLQVETSENKIKDNCDLSGFDGYMRNYISSAKKDYTLSNYSRINEVAEKVNAEKENTKITQTKK